MSDRIPSGTRDVLPDEMGELRAMTERIRDRRRRQERFHLGLGHGFWQRAANAWHRNLRSRIFTHQAFADQEAEEAAE